MWNPNPIVRGVATALALIGTFIARDVTLLAIVYLIIVVPLLLFAKLGRVHTKFLLVGIIPLAIGLLLLWGVIVAAAPGMPNGSAPIEGVKHALLISVRLATIAGIFQLCFLSLPFRELIAVLARWGVKGDSRVLIASAFTIWPELQLRAGQIVTARYARGLVKDRSFTTTVRQLPFLLRPLLTWALHTGLARAELWHQQNLLENASQVSPSRRGSVTADVFYVIAALSWMAMNLTNLFR